MYDGIPSAIEPGRHKVSKKYIPLTILRAFRQLVVALLAAAAASIRGIMELDIGIPLPLIILGVIVVIAIPCTIGSVIGYKRFSWEITDEELHIYKGLISRKQLHVPYRRIHSAEIGATVFDRILGVVTLKMDTAGGTGKAADVRIPALEMAMAEAIRGEVFRRKAMAEQPSGGSGVSSDSPAQASTITGNLQREGGRFSSEVGVYFDSGRETLGQAVATEEGVQYRLSTKELILSGISSGSSLLMILLAFSALSQFAGLLGTEEGQLWQWIGTTMMGIIRLSIIVFAVFVVGILLFAMAVSVVGKVITLWNFTVRRSGRSIEIRRGLLEKKSSSIAVDRIQAVHIKQGMLRRLIGYAEITVERVAAVNDTQGGVAKLLDNTIHPFIKRSKADDFLRAILPEFADAPKEDALERLGGKALRRSCFRHIRWTLLLAILPAAVACHILRTLAAPHWGGAVPLAYAIAAAGLLVFALSMLRAYLAWRARALGMDEKMATIRFGGFGKHLVYIPRHKIQMVTRSQNPFQRLASLATIHMHSASPAMRQVGIIDVTDAFADTCLDWVESYMQIVRQRG
ncbi:MAG: PH domain-containing protein [Clostridiales Family XIII bacterium]|jgi:putative membrane protein|nr:PH domain-containing protein [Clostridiales Family XIII bacterium]